MKATRGAVFVMPRPSTEWADAAAMWITVAGWAHAAEARLGSAWVVTPDAVADAETVLTYTESRPRASNTGGRRSLTSYAPKVAVTGAKDVRRMRRARAYDVGERPQWTGCDLVFVWQHHDLFHTSGHRLAEHRGIPLVSYVHAPQVWEARKWGVRRPGWARALERWGEIPSS